MRKIREVLRLTHELGPSVRQVRAATGVGKTAVSEYVARAKVIGITWPIPAEISDAELERRLFTPAGFHDCPTRTVPEWTKVHEELKRRGVILMLLWEEHRAECADGHGYSRFCELYSEWRKRLSPTMRQTHVAGDKLFVDWAGDTVPIVDAMTGEVHEAHLFVAALGASSYTYAEARWTETLSDWIGAHVNALDFLGGVPKAAVPDNQREVMSFTRYRPSPPRNAATNDPYTLHYIPVLYQRGRCAVIDYKRLRQTIPIDGVLELLGIQAKWARKQLRSKCPLCRSKIPRCFAATPSIGLWHCFACRRSGDAIQLYADLRKLPLRDAAKELVQHFKPS